MTLTIHIPLLPLFLPYKDKWSPKQEEGTLRGVKKSMLMTEPPMH